MLNQIALKKRTLAPSQNIYHCYFILFCLLHWVIWTLAQSYIYANPPTDAVESVAWGNLWLWGYEKHPPLAAWLSATFTNTFGVVGWPIYALSQLAILTCFFAIWRLGKQILPPLHALCAVMLLEGINYYNLQSAAFNPNVLMLPLWALVTLYFYQALKRNQWRDWILLGIFAGLAILAKYESALLLLILFAFLVTDSQYRWYFLRIRLYIALALTLLIMLPNFIWLSLHHFNALIYAMDEMNGHYPSLWQQACHIAAGSIKFLGEQIGNILPVFILSLPLMNTRSKDLQVSTWDLRFLRWLALMPLIATILFANVFQINLISRWGFPFFSVLPLFLLAIYKPEITCTHFKIFCALIMILNISLISGHIYKYQIRPFYTNHSPYSASFPGKTIAKRVTQMWHQKFNGPLFYAAGDHHLVVNISAFSEDNPKPFFNWRKSESPWIDENDMKKQGAVFVVWIRDPSTYAYIKTITNKYPGLIHPTIIDFKRYTNANVPKIKIWVAFLPPQSQQNHV